MGKASSQKVTVSQNLTHNTIRTIRQLESVKLSMFIEAGHSSITDRSLFWILVCIQAAKMGCQLPLLHKSDRSVQTFKKEQKGQPLLLSGSPTTNGVTKTFVL